MSTTLATSFRYLASGLLFVALFSGCERKMPESVQFVRETQQEVGPNIVLIIAGSLGSGDLGCYGQQKIETPNMDRIAAEGCRFSTAYAGGVTQDATYWCLMTGRHNYSARNGNALSYVLRNSQRTLPETLQLMGYDTCFVGNWPLQGDTTYATPNAHGFSHWAGTMSPSATDELYPVAFWRNGEETPVRASSDGEDRPNLQQLCVDEAVSYLKRQQPESPFMLVVALPSPGDAVDAPVSDSYADTDWPASAKAHASRVAQLDSDVGTILDLLDELGLAQRTAVFLTSDNARTAASAEDIAFLDSAGGLRIEGGELYEGRLRVPLIARWPGVIEPETVTDYPATIWDMTPTFVEMSGNRLPASAGDGESLVAAMRGEKLKPRRMLYWEIREGGFGQAVRIGDYKAVRPRGKLAHEDVELYNLKYDPGETKNVASENPEILATFIP